MSAEGTVSWSFSAPDPAARRQSFSRSFRPSGAVYVSSVDSLRKHRAFIVSGVSRGVPLPESRAIDVDTAEDLAIAGALAAARSISAIDVAGRRIGPAEPVFVIAEAGVNHNGDVELAHRLVDVAADAGADAVKFQTFDPKRLVSPKASMARYQVLNTGRAITQAEMLAELVLPRAAHRELSDHAKDRGLLFLSSPFDEASADFLDELGVPAFKVGSGELTNHPLFVHLAAKGKPLLVSTGMADMIEVDGALDAIRDGGNPPVCLLHCVTSYPASAGDANLRAIGTMKAAFGLPVGFSDHTEGTHVSLAAVALGACVIEKHFTLDRSLRGPDHRASLLPDELAALVRQIHPVEESLGDGDKHARPAELSLVAPARKSLHAAHDLPRGHVLVASDVVALRPGNGIPPSRLASLIGRKLARDVASGELLEEAHFA
jgi:N-acetylneuraminate synthase/N,N'-diacetyllegionaminate synthase